MTAIDSLPLFVSAARDRALAQVEAGAGEDFMRRAERHALLFLATVESASGEEITNTCLESGIEPLKSTKVFGAVIRNLSRAGKIEWVGFAKRTKGHGCAGASRWRLKK